MRKVLLLSFFGVAVSSAVYATSDVGTSVTPWITSENCLYAQQGETATNCYSYNNSMTFGSVEYDETTEITTLASTEDAPAHAMVDAAVDTDANDYIVMVSFTQAEEVREDITGLPYIYGYQMNEQGYIEQYMQSQSTIDYEAEAGEWSFNYGIFPVESDTVAQVRFFMMQGLSYGSEYNGSKALFKRPGVFVVSTEQEAEELINAYREALNPQVIDTITPKKIKPQKVKIKWEPQENAEKYIVKVKQAKKDNTRKFEVEATGAPIDDDANDPSLKIEELKPDKDYVISVRAVVNGAKGEWTKQQIHTPEKKD